MERLLDTFPYDEHRLPSGDLFRTLGEAVTAGWPENQVWSVAPVEEGNGWTFGPPHHWLNGLGYVATVERHDHDTYYEDAFDDSSEAP